VSFDSEIRRAPDIMMKRISEKIGTLAMNLWLFVGAAVNGFLAVGGRRLWRARPGEPLCRCAVVGDLQYRGPLPSRACARDSCSGACRAMGGSQRVPYRCPFLFTAGVVLFSGSLYFLVLAPVLCAGAGNAFGRALLPSRLGSPCLGVAETARVGRDFKERPDSAILLI